MNKKIFSLFVIVFLLIGNFPFIQSKNFNISSNGNTLFFVNGTIGNVGIGTTTPGSKLTIIGTQSTGVSMGGGSGVFGGLSFNREFATGTIFNSTSSAYQINNANTSLNFQVYNGAGALITNNALTISNSGNIGIGTTSPSGKAEIYQGMSNYSLAFTSPHLNLGTSDTVDTTGFVGITYDASTSANYGWSSGALRSTNGQSSFVWKYHNNDVVGVERMRINEGGNVGIGTASPTSVLTVSGNASISGNTTIDSGLFFVDTSANKVGIGTTNPTGKLEVYTGAANTADGIVLSQGGANSGRFFLVNGSGSGNSIVKSGSNLQFNTGATPLVTSGTTRMVLTDDGNVGINAVPTSGAGADTSKLLINSDVGTTSNSALNAYYGGSRTGALGEVALLAHRATPGWSQLYLSGDGSSTNYAIYSAGTKPSYFGGNVDLNRQIVTSSSCLNGCTATATCPAGLYVLGGGCREPDGNSPSVMDSWPSATNAWSCRTPTWNGNYVQAYAICDKGSP